MILFIDDERKYIKGYIEELEYLGFKVRHINEIKESLAFINSAESEEIDLLVLDVMMPLGEDFIDEEDENLDNGIKVYEEFRKRFPTKKIFVLTNVTRQYIVDYFERDANCNFIRKDDEVLPVEFAKLIQEELKR